MAPALTELWRSVAPEDIDTSLPDLWRDAARESPVSRALMSNLVIVRHGELSVGSDIARLQADSDIGRIAERHPARIILLNYCPSVGRPCGPSKASIGVLTFGAGTARYGVEVIAVDAVCDEASMPSIVRRLTRGDVPTTMWWTADLSQIRPAASTVETGRQLLYDSANWHDVGEGARVARDVLALAHPPDLADLNWQRLAPLRWALVHSLGHETGATSLQAAGTAIRHRAGERTAAWLIAAWLTRALGWTVAPAIEEVNSLEEVVEVTLKGHDWEVTAAINDQRVRAEGSGGRPPYSIPVSGPSVADAVIAELRSLGRDVYLRETMIALATLEQ